jgi:hypothetical protein
MSLESKLKRQHLRKEGDLLDCLRKHNPKIFYKYFCKRKPKNIPLELESFHTNFKDLGNSIPTDNTNSFTMEDIGTTVFDELDKEITEKEIDEATGCLKRGKSHGLDYILNEYFIEFKEFFVPLLHIIFNRIFSSGFFPTQWSDAVIVPVFKKGDPTDPNNYRRIRLISCFCKLFTSILNRRLMSWANAYDIISDAQFGFQPNVGT